MTRILIVEDDEDIASVLCRGLQAEGFVPEATTDPGHAHRLLVAGGFDAAIIDRMLGEDSGLDLLRALVVRVQRGDDSQLLTGRRGGRWHCIRHANRIAGILLHLLDSNARVQ